MLIDNDNRFTIIIIYHHYCLTVIISIVLIFITIAGIVPSRIMNPSAVEWR